MLKTSLVMLAIFAGVAGNEALAQQQKKSASGTSETITFDMLVKQYNFPVKKHSDDPVKDQQEYAAAKTKWIAANRALYQRYNQQGAQTDGSLRTRHPESKSNKQSIFSPAN